MPLFHLNLKPGPALTEDEPQEFANLEEAREEAIQSLRELAANAIRDGRSFDYAGIEITDQQGVKHDSVAATEAIPQLSANRTAPQVRPKFIA